MAIQYPLNFILFLPTRNNSADNGDKSSSDISGIVKNICSEVEKRFPANIVLWTKVYGNENLGSDGFYGGIACGDDALNQINSTYFGKIPILALTGMTKTRDDGNGMEKGVYPLCPLPGFSGFLFSRSIIASWEAKSKKDSKKKPTIAFLGMEKADDPQRKRFAAFERTLRSHLQEPLIEVFPFSSDDIKKPQTIFGKLKCWEKTIGKTIDYVACFGYGEGYDNLITSLAKDFKSTEFWCDYNFTEDHPHNNIQRIGLRSCMGKDFFIQMACAGADILKTAFQQEKPGEETALDHFEKWVVKRGFFQSSIGTLWFVRSGAIKSFTLRQTFYRTMEDGGVCPVDSIMPEEVLPAENLIDFLDKADTLTMEWTGENSSPEQLINKVSKKLKSYFRDLHEIDTIWPGKITCDESTHFFGYARKSSPLHEAVNAIMSRCVGKTHTVQINLVDDDMEDNGVFRLYARRKGGKEPLYVHVPIREFLTNTDQQDSLEDIRIGPNARDATISLSDRSQEVVNLLRVCLSSSEGSSLKGIIAMNNLRYIYLLDCTPREHMHSDMPNDENRWLGIAYTVEKLNARKVKILHQVLKSAYSAIMVHQEKSRTRKAQIQSAIGSIMSRNGSHNIGSHVLAALSHNVGTMPDDRVLYQYIQHRMDYIATATTDFPTWRQPTMFLGAMMKTFLSQRHLLDNIAGSEELHAWKFQGRNANKDGDVSAIQIYIRAVKDGRRKQLLEYDIDDGIMHLEDDVSLAIPGGTVGQHAFFTIIENIIRNAAKHDWSSPPEKTRDKKFNGNTIVGNLKVFIDFKDLPEEGNVEFTVFSNMSDADDNVFGSNGNVTLLDFIRESLNEKFINENGALRKENWGLAEMKISAGYLQMREPGVIGGLVGRSEKAKDDNVRFGKILEPCPIRIDETDNVNHLGYRFKVPKTRTLLIITDRECLNPNDNDRRRLLARHGVYVKTKSDAEADDNSFEFILMDAFTTDRLKWRLPFRIICTKPEECDKRTLPLIAQWDVQGETTANIVEKLVKFDNGEIDEAVEVLLEEVAACWTQYFKTLRRGIQGPLSLVVSTKSKDDKSGQSLVNPAAAVRFVFEEGFDKAADSFWTLMRKRKGDYPRDWVLETEKAICHLKGKAKQNDVDETVKQSDGILSSLVIRQLDLWLADSKEISAEGILKYLSGKKAGGGTGVVTDEKFKNHPFKQFVDYLTEVCVQAKGYLGQYAEQIPTIPKKFVSFSNDKENRGRIDDSSSEGWEKGGVELCENPLDGSFCNPETNSNENTRKIIQYYRHYEPTAYRETAIEVPSFITTPFKSTNNLYIEPLSGTQSYFAQMRMLMENNKPNLTADQRLFQSKLVESALTRILIIDERVSRFVKNHSDLTLATFALMNISVADDKIVTNELELRKNETIRTESVSKEKVEYTPRGLVKLDADGVVQLCTAIKNNNTEELEELARQYKPFKASFDVLIVHQGILDKWFHELVSNEREMSDLYDSFKKVFPYVIITTGRGTPANIPDMARVLPFSTIETTLFRKYPEKLVLVDAIMNILPIKRSSNQVPKEV